MSKRTEAKEIAKQIRLQLKTGLEHLDLGYPTEAYKNFEKAQHLSFDLKQVVKPDVTALSRLAIQEVQDAQH